MIVEYLVEVVVRIDEDEIDDETETKIRRAIESLDPSVGVFEVNSIQ